MRIARLKGYENILDIYTVDEKGNIYSEFKEGYLNISDNGHGYKTVSLKLKGVTKNSKRYIHRIVAHAFLENPDNKPQVNHKDENKSNNALNNLEWCDSEYNNNYGNKIIKYKESVGTKIEVYNYKNEFIKEFLSLSDATIEILGFKNTKCLNKMSGGFVFLEKGKCTFKTAIKNSKNKPVILIDIINSKKTVYKNQLVLKKMFENKINITDIIEKKHTIKKQFKVTHYYGEKI